MKHLLLLVCLNIGFFSCTKNETYNEAYVNSKTLYRLTDPEVFNLGIPKEFFVGKLQSNRKQSICHTQGLYIDKNRIFVSCILYNMEEVNTRSYYSEAFLLEADLSHILNKQKTIQWTLHQFAQDVAKIERKRISQTVFGDNDVPKGAHDFMYKLSHPSGMERDVNENFIWLTPSVYGPKSSAHFRKYNIDRGRFMKEFWHVPDHSGLVLPLDNNIIVGVTWGSKEFLALDTKTGQYKLYENTLPELVDYQDSTRLSSNIFLCGGKAITKTWNSRIHTGRIHVLHINGSSYDKLSFELMGFVRMKNVNEDMRDLGVVEYVYKDYKGTIQEIKAIKSTYAGVETNVTLPHEGMSLDPEKQWLYFVPQDLPDAKLFRYKISKIQ